LSEISTPFLVDKQEYFLPQGSSLLDIAQKVYPGSIHTIVAAKMNNEIQELNYVPECSYNIHFIDIMDEDGLLIYVRSLSFIFIRATREILKDARVVIEHSLSKGLYCEIHWEKPITSNDITKIEERMHEIITADEPFIKTYVSLSEALDIFKKDGQSDKVNILPYRKFDYFNLYQCGWMYDYFYGYMVPSTGYLKTFVLHFYLPGVILLYPNGNIEEQPLRFVEQPKLAKIYNEAKKWGKITGISNVADINNMIMDGQGREIVRISEALHEKKIAEIADMIFKNSGRGKIILIAGPSSSGKTTFGHRLSIQLKVLGLHPVSISLDNYFFNREQAPLDENGKYDFEDIKAIDTVLFNEQLSKLLLNQKVELPIFNFNTGIREYHHNYLEITGNQPIIVEGIHGLNEVLTEMIPKENKYKIYVSTLTQLNLDDHNRIPSTDTRLIRRIVRDYNYRSSSPSHTLAMWKSVKRGEEKNIFPYQEDADIMFNSSLSYELSILIKYISPLLKEITNDDPHFMEAKRLLKFLDYFIPLDADDEIPPTSILREFIGNCSFYRQF